jgi:hypothetical protein
MAALWMRRRMPREARAGRPAAWPVTRGPATVPRRKVALGPGARPERPERPVLLVELQPRVLRQAEQAQPAVQAPPLCQARVVKIRSHWWP